MLPLWMLCFVCVPLSLWGSWVLWCLWEEVCGAGYPATCKHAAARGAGLCCMAEWRGQPQLQLLGRGRPQPPGPGRQQSETRHTTRGPYWPNSGSTFRTPFHHPASVWNQDRTKMAERGIKWSAYFKLRRFNFCSQICFMLHAVSVLSLSITLVTTCRTFMENPPSLTSHTQCSHWPHLQRFRQVPKNFRRKKCRNHVIVFLKTQQSYYPREVCWPLGVRAQI